MQAFLPAHSINLTSLLRRYFGYGGLLAQHFGYGGQTLAPLFGCGDYADDSDQPQTYGYAESAAFKSCIARPRWLMVFLISKGSSEKVWSYSGTRKSGS